MSKPNVLFLFSDQHNARCLSCAQHDQVLTPHLDRLASEGTRFVNAYANNPICTPSRISVLSSLYPSTHGYYGLYGPEPVAPMTSIFRTFKENGYRTGALGKLHTPRYWIEKDCQFVYDEFVEFPKYLEGAGLYELNDNRAFTGNRNGEASRLPYEISCEAALAKQTIRFIRNEGEVLDRGKETDPWFAWVSFSRPHQPYTPSQPFAGQYAPESIVLPPTHEREKEEIRLGRGEMPEARLRQLLSAYYGLISQVDHAIGTILEELELSGKLENTIVVYSSDHGDYAGEHGLMEKTGGISYRAITRIPLIVRMPAGAGEETGRVKDDLVEAVDLFPTLCELAGFEAPNTVQGISFAPIVRGEAVFPPMRDSALTENAYRKAIATKSWRYVANLDGEQPDELYHLDDDPWELHNVIDDPIYEGKSKEMLRMLLDRVVRARKPIHSINGMWHHHLYDRDGRMDLTRNAATNAYW
jgi:choline-sulfatase/uncharacterized sulfatase